MLRIIMHYTFENNFKNWQKHNFLKSSKDFKNFKSLLSLMNVVIKYEVIF